MLTNYSLHFYCFFFVCFIFLVVLRGCVDSPIWLHVRGNLKHLKTLVSGLFVPALQNLQQLKHSQLFFLFSRHRESKLSNSGWRGQYFDIQQPEIGKVRKNSAGITCSLQQRILMLQQQERCPPLSQHTLSLIASWPPAPEPSRLNVLRSVLSTIHFLCL